MDKFVTSALPDLVGRSRAGPSQRTDAWDADLTEAFERSVRDASSNAASERERSTVSEREPEHEDVREDGRPGELPAPLLSLHVPMTQALVAPTAPQAFALHSHIQSPVQSPDGGPAQTAPQGAVTSQGLKPQAAPPVEATPIAPPLAATTASGWTVATPDETPPSVDAAPLTHRTPLLAGPLASANAALATALTAVLPTLAAAQATTRPVAETSMTPSTPTAKVASITQDVAFEPSVPGQPIQASPPGGEVNSPPPPPQGQGNAALAHASPLLGAAAAQVGAKPQTPTRVQSATLNATSVTQIETPTAEPAPQGSRGKIESTLATPQVMPSLDAVANQPSLREGRSNFATPTAPHGGTTRSAKSTGNDAGSQQDGKAPAQAPSQHTAGATTSQSPSQTPPVSPMPALLDADLGIGLNAPSAITSASAATTPGVSGTHASSGAQATAPTAGANLARPAHAHVQLAQSIVRSFDGGTAKLEMRLDPPELGRVQVKLEVGADQRVSASIAAESPATLAELARNARELERILESAGLELDPSGLNFTLNDQPPKQDNGAAQMSSSGGDTMTATTHAGDAPRESARPFGLETWRAGRVDLWA